MSTASDSTADSAKKGKGKGSWFKTPKKGEKGAASPGKSPSHSQSDKDKDKDKDTGTDWMTTLASLQSSVGRKKIMSKDLEEMCAEWYHMKQGMLYLAADDTLTAMRLNAQDKCFLYGNIPPTRPVSRENCIKDMLGSSGAVTVVEPPFMCDYGVNIHVGENFYANFNCCILDGADVTIGDDVMFGPAVHVYTAHHPIESDLRYSGKELCHPVTIGNRVWVGGRAVINPGVVIGDDVVIGAGAVVTKDVPSGVVVAGNPAVIIRKLNQADKNDDNRDIGHYCERRAKRVTVGSKISSEDISRPARKIALMRSKSFEEEEAEEVMTARLQVVLAMAVIGGLASLVAPHALKDDVKRVVSGARDAAQDVLGAACKAIFGSVPDAVSA